jgi:predicted transcriptional regulator of viral defense system
MYYLYYVIKVKHKTIRDMNITWLEDKTLSTFIGCLYAEPGYSDVDVNDISEILDIPTKTIRGALGSLVKKGIITIDRNDSGYDIIYLNKNYWGMVNESWAEAANY